MSTQVPGGEQRQVFLLHTHFFQLWLACVLGGQHSFTLLSSLIILNVIKLTGLRTWGQSIGSAQGNVCSLLMASAPNASQPSVKRVALVGAGEG